MDVSRSPVGPADLVARGGTMKIEGLHKAVETAAAQLGRPGLSVCAAAGCSPAQLVATAAFRIPHPVVSFTTVGRLTVKGFEVEQTGGWPHHTVWLPENDPENWDYWLREFRMTFDASVERDQLDDCYVSQV